MGTCAGYRLSLGLIRVAYARLFGERQAIHGHRLALSVTGVLLTAAMLLGTFAP
jgi:hypothetical protein